MALQCLTNRKALKKFTAEERGRILVSAIEAPQKNTKKLSGRSIIFVPHVAAARATLDIQMDVLLAASCTRLDVAV